MMYKDIALLRTCSSKYEICYVTHPTFNVWMLFMIVILKIQFSIPKDKNEKSLILYCFTIYKSTQLSPIEWICFGPVTKTKKIYKKCLNFS